MKHALAPLLALSALASAALEPGPAVDYAKLAFQPRTWAQKGVSTQLTPWTGSNVVFLTVGDRFDHDLMERWVRNLDAGWSLYADLTGRRPGASRQLDGRAPIAAVPDGSFTCGAGCGFVGHTGIELAMFYDHNYPALQRNPRAMPHYVFYEMGRNFYTFGDRHSCFITGFAVFMRYVCMDTLGCEDVEPGNRSTIERAEALHTKGDLSFLKCFTNADGLTEKQPRLKDPQGRWLNPSDQPVTYASAMLRLHRECGGNAWLKRFYARLATAPEAKPDTPAGALMQCRTWYLCASLAARRDLSPIFVDAWRLPMDAPTRAAMANVDWTDEKQVVADLRQKFQ
jgi:hypothetical protein